MIIMSITFFLNHVTIYRREMITSAMDRFTRGCYNNLKWWFNWFFVKYFVLRDQYVCVILLKSNVYTYHMMIWCNLYGWYRQLWVSVLKPRADMRSDMDFQCKTRITTLLLYSNKYFSNKFWNFMKILNF
jgi:hypothetical protein